MVGLDTGNKMYKVIDKDGFTFQYGWIRYLFGNSKWMVNVCNLHSNMVGLDTDKAYHESGADDKFTFQYGWIRYSQ